MTALKRFKNWNLDLADARVQAIIAERTAERKRQRADEDARLARLANLPPLDTTPRPPAERRLITPNDIINVVCQAMNVTRDELASKRRHPHIVLARALSTAMCRNYTRASYPEITREVGRPNHSTCITAHQKLEKRIKAGGTWKPTGYDAIDLAALYDRMSKLVADEKHRLEVGEKLSTSASGLGGT